MHAYMLSQLAGPDTEPIPKLSRAEWKTMFPGKRAYMCMYFFIYVFMHVYVYSCMYVYCVVMQEFAPVIITCTPVRFFRPKIRSKSCVLLYTCLNDFLHV